MNAPSSLTQGLALLGAAIDRERSGRPGHTASRLAEVTGIERSRVSRVTAELRRMEYLERDDTAVLAAGPEFFRVAAARNDPWLRAARYDLRMMASALKVTARVTAAAGAGALLVRSESGVVGTDIATRPGMLTPIWCTGAGRALLWDHDRAGLEDLLRDAQFVGVGGPAAARTVAELDALLARDRDRGVIVAADEYVDGVHEYALPIRAHGAIVASVAVSGPRPGAGREKRILALLRDSAARLNALAERG